MLYRLTALMDVMILLTLQVSINEINHTYEEVSLTLQTLQATSYDGHYICKIPDITRHIGEMLLTALKMHYVTFMCGTCAHCSHIIVKA